jgi:HAD superfamily hydrolase (TIGR01509 family)
MFSVIFDMDGTLLDTQRICIPAWEYAGNLQGFKGAGEALTKICGMNEAGWSKFLEDTFKGIDIVSFKKEMREYIIKNGVVKYKEGAPELLEFLKKNNIKMAIASGSSKESIKHHLKEVGAEKYFSVLVGGKDVENGKPAPDIFLKAAALLGEEPRNCIVFEDSENGALAAAAAGMRVFGVPDTVEFSDKVKALMVKCIDSLKDAEAYLKGYLEEK